MVNAYTNLSMANSLISLIPAHFCFLMGCTGFGPYSRKITKIVLIGQDHTAQFEEFATNEGMLEFRDAHLHCS